MFVASIKVPTFEERSQSVADDKSAMSDESTERAQSFFVRAVAGFGLIKNDKKVLALVLLYILQCVVAGASAVFTVAIALQLLHIGSSGLGLMESLLGIGGLLGGFVALLLVERSHLAMDFGLGVIVWAAPLILIALLPDLATAFISMWLIGLANSIVDVNAITIFQRIVPNEKLGRVLGALEGGEIAGMAIGSLLMTVFIHWFGLRVGLALIGISVTVAVLPGLPAMRSIDKVAFAQSGEALGLHNHRLRHFHHLRWRHSR